MNRGQDHRRTAIEQDGDLEHQKTLETEELFPKSQWPSIL
jgi:hypothetical protein